MATVIDSEGRYRAQLRALPGDGRELLVEVGPGGFDSYIEAQRAADEHLLMLGHECVACEPWPREVQH